ncbi:MAG: Ig-like domain-containing protein [Myxococcota bacterium]|nr:Ig-like domain-containing protein [Myxococcota bacterium]
MHRSRAWWVAMALGIATAIGCGSEPVAPELDAGTDGGPPPPIDAWIEPDVGPPQTGCDRLDAGIDAAAHDDDAGTLEPGAFPRASGPGGPRTTFTAAQLYEHCGYMDFGATDERHHNTGFMLDGYLVRPWAHERGRGGVAVFEMDEPCAPVTIANVLDEQIRETHATGFSSALGGRWIAVASLRGIQFWDMSDMTAPRMAHDLELPGVRYPDAYMRTIMSVFWQAPYLYAGASDNGVFVIDAGDPTAPRLVHQFQPVPNFRVGNVHAIGNLLVVMASEGSLVALYDIGVPDAPRPIAGGNFLISNGRLDRFGRPYATTAYFGMVNGGLGYHARNGLGGGLAIYDLRTPSAPTFVSNIDADDADGGYVYLHEGIAFVGMSQFAVAYDVSDPTMPREVARFDLEGDLDTITPLGNVVLLSVDDDAVDGRATAIAPWRESPDARGPRVNWVVPADGAVDQAITTRVGLTFDEFVAMESVWRGSIVVREVGTGTVIPGALSGQEGVVNFWPAAPLRPSTEYEVLVPPGGVHDVSGNALTEQFRATFTTVGCGE